MTKMIGSQLVLRQVGCVLLSCWMALASTVAQAEAAALPFAPPAADQRVIYRGGSLIDGTSDKPRTGMAVITRGDAIEAVVPESSLTPALVGKARIIDLAGGYLLPGLIDSHQHIATPPDRVRAAALMRRDVYSGITATRIMADDLRSVAEIARAARLGEIASPDLIFAALMAGPSFFDDPRTSAAALGMPAGHVPWMQSIDDKTDLPLAVARAAGTGAVAIKIYANLPPHLVLAIAREAHRQGLKVWAHGMVFPTLPADVIAAGPDVISHTCYLAYQLSPQPPQRYQDRSPIDPAPFANGDNPEMARLFAEMKRRDILLDPTLRVYREGDLRARRPGAKPPHCTLALGARLTNQAYRAGISISAGTDGDTPATAPYPGLFDELELLVHSAGLTPIDAIRAATIVGAGTIAQADTMGTLAPGKLANMVVVARNPLADIANMRSVTMTVKRGRVFDRSDFHGIGKDEVRDD